jgi:hypothetical protein
MVENREHGKNDEGQDSHATHESISDANDRWGVVERTVAQSVCDLTDECSTGEIVRTRYGGAGPVEVLTNGISGVTGRR